MKRMNDTQIMHTASWLAFLFLVSVSSHQSHKELGLNFHKYNNYFFPFPDTEMVKMKRVLELLTSENDEKVQSGMSAATSIFWMRHDSSFCLSVGEKD